MNYWLVKYAPFRHSWRDTLRHGRFEIDSVRNAQARNNLKPMRLGDEVLFYHSQEDKRVMGVMKAYIYGLTEEVAYILSTFPCGASG